MRLSSLFLIAFCVSSALAQIPSEKRGYLIVSYGEPDFDDEVARFTDLLSSDFGITGSFEQVFYNYSDQSFKVTDGYLLNPHFGIEGSLTFIDDSRIVVTGTVDDGSGTQIPADWRMDMRQYGFDFHAVGNLRLFKGLTGQAKLGGLIWRNEVDLVGTDTPRVKEDGGSVSLGLSLRFDFGQGLLASVDWQNTDIDGIDTSLTLIGIGFHY